jgi:hypothetical protein
MFAWVYLANGLWWPGCIQDAQSKASVFVHMPNLRIIKLNSLPESMIPIDISQEDSVHLLQESAAMTSKENFFHMHQDQQIPEGQSATFSCAVQELAAQLGVVAETPAEETLAAETETPLQLAKTTKRTTAIPWDNYFMAVAFLSA